jgi:hypothetical protein
MIAPSDSRLFCPNLCFVRFSRFLFVFIGYGNTFFVGRSPADGYRQIFIAAAHSRRMKQFATRNFPINTFN